MDVIALLLRLALAMLFGVAAWAKFADPKETRRTLESFGASGVLASVGVLALPLAEALAAGLLIFAYTSWVGAVLAFGLASVFSMTVLVSLMRGRRPPCNCLGQIGSAPIGPATLVRNLVLVGVTALLVFGTNGRPAANIIDTIADIGPDLGLWVAFGAAVLAQSWLILHLMRQNGRLFLKIDALELRVDRMGAGTVTHDESFAGLATGTSAPNFDLAALAGGRTALASLLERRKPVLLMFTDPHCEPCSAVLPALTAAGGKLASVLTIALISRGTAEDNKGKFGSLGIAEVLLQRDREVAEQFRMLGTPSAVLLGADGRLLRLASLGPEPISQLLANLVAEHVASASAVPTSQRDEVPINSRLTAQT